MNKDWFNPRKRDASADYEDIELIDEVDRSDDRDLTGEKFGKWTVIEKAAQRRYSYHVICECGTTAIRARYALIWANTTQCMKCYRKSGAYKDYKDAHHDLPVLVKGKRGSI